MTCIDDSLQQLVRGRSHSLNRIPKRLERWLMRQYDRQSAAWEIYLEPFFDSTACSPRRLCVPFFFGTITTGLAYLLVLGCIIPSCNHSLICAFRIVFSLMANRRGFKQTGISPCNIIRVSTFVCVFVFGT